MSLPPRPTPPHPPIEAKVSAAAAGSLLAAAAVAVLNAVQDNGRLLGGLPTWVQTALLVLVPPLLTWLAGYQAPHTARPDLLPPPIRPVKDDEPG
jgi:hypothetical protein